MSTTTQGADHLGLRQLPRRDRGRAQALRGVRDLPLLTRAALRPRAARPAAGRRPPGSAGRRSSARPCGPTGGGPSSSRARSSAQESSSARPSTSSCSRAESRQCDERGDRRPVRRAAGARPSSGRRRALLLGGLRVDGVGQVAAGRARRRPGRGAVPATCHWRAAVATVAQHVVDPGAAARSSRRAAARTSPARSPGTARSSAGQTASRSTVWWCRRTPADQLGVPGQRRRCARPRRAAPRTASSASSRSSRRTSWCSTRW